MALNAQLGFLFKATDQASGVMRRISLGLKMLTDGSSLAQRSMAGVALSLTGNAISNFAEQSVKAMLNAADASGKFTHQLTAAKNVIDGATDKDMSRLGNAAMDLGAQYGVGAQQMAEGIAEMGRAGLDANDIIKTLSPTLLFATSSQLDFQSASSVLLGTMRAFKKDFSETGIVVDKFANILNSTAAGGADIQSTFAKAASMAGMFGQDIDQTLVLLGLMRNLNIDASSISTNIRESHRRMFQMPTVMNHIKSLGIGLFDAEKKERSWLDIVFEIKDAIKGLTPELARAKLSGIFGARGIFAYEVATNSQITTMKNGRKEVVEFRKAFETLLEQQQKTGTAKKLADALAQTYEGQKQRLLSIAGNLRISIGKAFEETFQPILAKINDGLEAISTWLRDIGPEGRKTLATFVILEVAIIAMTGGIMALLGSLTLLKLTLPIIAPMLTPILFITGILLATTAGLTIAYKALQAETGKTGSFLNQLSEGFYKAKLFAQGLWQLLTTGKITGLPMEELLKKGNRGVLETLGTFWQMITRSKAAFEGFMDGLRTHLQNPAVQSALNELKSNFASLMETLGLGSKGLDKLTSTTGDARNMGKEWGKWLWWVTWLVLRLASAFIQLAEVAVWAVTNVIAPVVGFLKDSPFLRWAISLFLIAKGYQAIKAGVTGIWGNARAMWSMARAAQAWAAARAMGNNATQVLNKNGTVAASVAPGIGRQVLNFTGITALGQAITWALGKLGLSSLATLLAGSAAKMSLASGGLVAAAGLLGYGAGMLLDNWLGISDSLSKWFHDDPEWLKQKDGGVYTSTVSTREAPAFLAPAAAGGSMAAARLRSTQQMAASAASGVVLAPQAVAELSKIANRPVNATVNLDGQQVGEIVLKSQANMNASSFNSEDLE